MKDEFDENSLMRLSTATANHCSFYLPNCRRLPTKSCCENWSVWPQNSATLRILIAPYPRARSRVLRPCWLPDLGSFQCLRKIEKTLRDDAFSVRANCLDVIPSGVATLGATFFALIRYSCA